VVLQQPRHGVIERHQRRSGQHARLPHAAPECLAQPPRLPRESLVLALTPMQMSFLAESRRMDNRRMKRELRLVLGYPSVLDGLAEGLSAGLTSSYGAGPI